MTFTLTPEAPLPTLRKGRKSIRPTLTPYDAKEEAKRLLREERISPLCNQVLDALSVAGVLTNHQLHTLTSVQKRTLRSYHHKHLLDRLTVPLLDLRRYHFPEPTYVYTLGMVGIEIARYRHERLPTGYIGFGTHRIMHDLMSSQTVITLLSAALGHGIKPVWSSRYEATVHDDDNRPVLEPDGLVTLHHSMRQRYHLILEYHNEDHSGRAAAKVARYERTYRDGHWQRAWATDQMPPVLVAFTHQAVAQGYKEAVQSSTMGLRCTYLGKPWSSIVQNSAPGVWKNFRTGEMVDLLSVGADER